MVNTKREEEIEDVKTFVSMVGAATTEIQFKVLSSQAKSIRDQLERLLPSLTE